MRNCHCFGRNWLLFGYLWWGPWWWPQIHQHRQDNRVRVLMTNVLIMLRSWDCRCFGRNWRPFGYSWGGTTMAATDPSIWSASWSTRFKYSRHVEIFSQEMDQMHEIESFRNAEIIQICKPQKCHTSQIIKSRWNQLNRGAIFYLCRVDSMCYLIIEHNYTDRYQYFICGTASRRHYYKIALLDCV